jgi:hypothetical protein
MNFLIHEMYEKINLKVKRIILSHTLRCFSLWSLGAIVSGPVVRQKIMMRNTDYPFFSGPLLYSSFGW